MRTNLECNGVTILSNNSSLYEYITLSNSRLEANYM
jgi:hypothetical protein